MSLITAEDVLVCPDCKHHWDAHFSGDRGCAACTCTTARRVISSAERIAAIRAQVGDEPLVSHVDDKRTILIGHFVTEDRDGDDPRAGTVVERWHNDDGEPGVVTVDFFERGHALSIKTRRFLVGELRQEVLPRPDRYHCALTIRLLCRLIGQGVRTNGTAGVLDEYETRYLRWVEALQHAIQ